MTHEIFKCHIDPGHSWIEVPLERLADLGIGNQISAYSYQRGANAYLEEDCDAAIFVAAYIEHYGIEPGYHEIRWDNAGSNDCPVRTYREYLTKQSEKLSIDEFREICRKAHEVISAFRSAQGGDK